VKRREFITLLGGAATAWPLAARAQHSERMRRVGVLMTTVNDAEGQARIGAFAQRLQERGWTHGRNMQIETRWVDTAESIRRNAQELVTLGSDVIVATASAVVSALQQASRTVPIVFVSVIDPVGGGFVESLARPGGNTTGFMLFEYGLSGKWLELLKQLAPRMTRVAVIRDPSLTGGIGQFAAIQSIAPSIGVEVTPVNVRDADEIERAVIAFARSSGGGLIVTASPVAAALHRDLIITLAARHKLPAMYPTRVFATVGGLMSYGPDVVDQYRRGADYVDRVLRGENPADLPVQAPVKYELVINVTTAKALNLEIPDELLARADEVIE
jgi:ABC-type uncharacterized transport system substrate-binding protein